MKQGWEIKKLGEVCEIQGGSTPKRTESSFWDNGTYPWFTIEDIREQGHIISDTKQKITKIAWDKMRIFPRDTILLCCTASLGEYAITQIPLSSNQQFNGLTIKDKNYLSPMYLMHYCSTLKNTLLSLSGKATIDFVSAEKVRQIPIPIPPREEQERIVEILDREFERLDALKANAEQNLQHAKDLFQSALKQELQPKEEWETKTIGEIAELKGGKRVPKGYKLEINPTGYPYIRVADFNDIGTVDLDDIHYISKEVFEGIKRYIITTNDVYISIAGTIGKSGIIPEELNGANLTENACRLVFKEKAEKKYIYYCTIGCDFTVNKPSINASLASTRANGFNFLQTIGKFNKALASFK